MIGGAWPAQCSEGWEVNRPDRIISRSVGASHVTGPRWGPEAVGHLSGCLAAPRAVSWLVLTDDGNTGRRAIPHRAAFTVCGLRCYQLGNSCCQHLYPRRSVRLLLSCFSPPVSFSFRLSGRKRGLGLSSVAELRFRTCGGMVEPLIFSKGSQSPEQKDTPRKYET